MRPPAIGFAGWIALATCFGLAGCDASVDSVREESPPPVAPASPAGSPSPAAAAPDAPLPGELSLALEGDRISLRLGGVPLGRVLERLAEEGDFPVRGDVPPRVLTLARVDAPLGAVLAELLEGTPYAAHWEPPERAERSARGHRLAGLDVGRAAIAVEPGARGGRTRLEAVDERREPLAARQQETEHRAGRLPPPGPPPRVKKQDELVQQLESGDPEDRMEAIVELDTSGRGLDLVIAALDDRDPEVRVSAADRLGDEGTVRAIAALVGALRHEDPAVVVKSLELLAFAGDESLVDAIEPLQFHADPDVREAAEEALAELDVGDEDAPPPNSLESKTE